MAEFYRLPHWILTTLVMMISVCIIMQTQTIAYSIRRLCVSWVRRLENMLECSILIILFLFVALLAQVQYALDCQYLAYSDYVVARQVGFLLISIVGTITAVGTELIWPLLIVAAATVLLPVTEDITGQFYPLLFFISLMFYLIRSIHICLIRQRDIHTNISSDSIKEAIDKLRTGLLLYNVDGDILLSNRQMDIIAKQMTGNPLQNAKRFQQIIEDDILLNGCTREYLGGQQVFRLSNSTVWNISFYDIPMVRGKMMLLCADDVTQRWDAMKHLDAQNQLLQKRGEELRHTIENLQAICEAEEIARSKGKIHDILGQRISLLLRAIRDGQQPNKAMLIDFIHNLPTIFREEQVSSPAQRLKMLKDTFQGMDVFVEIQGELPEDEEVADNFVNIAAECVTNAVRHGYASCIQFHFFQNTYWRMNVTDNGIPLSKQIREGGGIKDMRRRIDRLGGTLELYTNPRFSIQIFVPKEGKRK